MITWKKCSTAILLLALQANGSLGFLPTSGERRSSFFRPSSLPRLYSQRTLLQASNSSWTSDGPRSTSTALSSSAANFGPGGTNVDHGEKNDGGDMSPPPMWGQPLSKETKEWNHDLVHTLKGFLFDKLFGGDTVDRAYARFYALETIARMPYFSYLSVLHLFETLGLWRRANYLKVHFAESWNEMHHLLIMEELGGNDRWGDRFVAQHIAFGYYWVIVGLYIFNPIHAYHLNQMVEEEAYGTYDKFISENRDFLANKPAPQCAVEYYTGQDLYLFDAMHHEISSPRGPNTPEPRRPPCKTLLDCFVNIRDDEQEHVKTMAYFQEGAD